MHQENPFSEIESCEPCACENAELIEKKQRNKTKYFVVDVKYVAFSQKELCEYLEANDDIAECSRIIKGDELVAKRKATYTF